MKRTLWVLFVLLFGFALRAEECATTAAASAPATVAAPEAAATGEAAAAKDGYALLNALLNLFDNLAPEKKGAPGEEKVTKGGLALVDEKLSQLARDAAASLEAGAVDKIFYYRYKRMLSIYKMIITPVVKNELLENPFMKAFEDFVWSVTYERWAWEDKDSIAKMAAAMEEEFVQMMTYLDTRQKRQELKVKIGKRMLPPPPPPPGAKKKPEEKKPE